MGADDSMALDAEGLCRRLAREEFGYGAQRINTNANITNAKLELRVLRDQPAHSARLRQTAA